MRNVFTIPPSLPFAETLARGIAERVGQTPLALAEVTIYVPTRRAARNFADAFARAFGGAALLPELRPLGDADEDLALFDAAADAADLPPAISPLRRKMLLATLVRRWYVAERRESLTFAQATQLATSLASLLDEFETQGVAWEGLENLVPEMFAQHWANARDLLLLLRDEWPKLLAAEKTMNPAARRNAALATLAKRLEPSERWTIAAGSTGSIPATATLLGVIAALPKGAVVLPGLDQASDTEAWEAIGFDPAHPQYGMKQLLERIGITRETVRDWTRAAERNEARETLLRETLRPAPTTDAWRRIADDSTAKIAEGVDGLSVIPAPDASEEAGAVAVMMREALEKEGRSAALVTPDRTLARRVAAALSRWDIDVDDSAGRPFARTPPGAFLCLLAEAALARFAPVPLISLLKHPLALLGKPPGECRRFARELDLVLRGPRPDPGFDGLEAAILRASPKERVARLTLFFAALADVLRPLEHVVSAQEIDLDRLVDAHLSAAIRLSEREAGASALWDGEAGEAGADFVAELMRAVADLPPIETDNYAAVFRSLAEDVAVRAAYGRHPRLAILSPQEARLQTYDVLILSGLNEGVWPRAAPGDPWLSRPMRATLGLEAPERAIGLSAHDFATLASSPNVILTRALKSDGAPTVASRWLQRLTQFTNGLKIDKELEPRVAYVDIARALDDAGAPQRIARPRPTPPVSARPRRLSVTEIETWRRDPYATYAKRVLNLTPLDPLDTPVGPLERGTIVHRALETFVRLYPNEIRDDAVGKLISIAEDLFREYRLPNAVMALWRPRFAAAASLFVSLERERRVLLGAIHAEVTGERKFEAPAGEFVLHGRADRIDVFKHGGASIIDYKTGAPPSEKQVKLLLSPQLPLEAAMLSAGGFPEIGARPVAELAYMRIGSGAEPVQFRPLNLPPAEIAEKAAAWLSAQIARFDEESTGYVSRAIAFRRAFAGEYDHLARVKEWTAAQAEDPEE